MEKSWQLAAATVLILICGPTRANPVELTALPEEILSCSVCHGTMLSGNPVTAAPGLAGLPQWYMANQLNAFKNAWRGSHTSDHSGAEMYAVARKLNQEKINQYSSFIANLPEKQRQNPPVTAIEGDIQQGEAIYKSCASCHGTQAEGIRDVQAPPLTRQGIWYLKSQLLKFQKGQRGYQANDIQGSIMANAAKVLKSEQDIHNVISYIASLNTPKRKPR